MLDVKPIFSALMRNKAGLALIVLQVAITLAVVCNSLFIILERAERMGKPSGMDDRNTFVIRSLGFVKGFDLKSAMQQDLDAIRGTPGVLDATATNTIPMSFGGWNTGVDTQPLDDSGERRAQSSALYFTDEHGVSTLGAELVEGRDFDASDVSEFTPGETEIPAKSVIVTKALATALFPDDAAAGKPLAGKQIYGIGGSDNLVTIVGVVETLQQPWPTSRSVEQSTLIPSRLIDSNSSLYVIRAPSPASATA